MISRRDHELRAVRVVYMETEFSERGKKGEIKGKKKLGCRDSAFHIFIPADGQ